MSTRTERSEAREGTSYSPARSLRSAPVRVAAALNMSGDRMTPAALRRAAMALTPAPLGRVTTVVSPARADGPVAEKPLHAATRAMIRNRLKVAEAARKAVLRPDRRSTDT